MNRLNESIVTKKDYPVKVLQFGADDFLRCFVDWSIQQLNNNGILKTNVCVVQTETKNIVDELKTQDGLYTVILEGLRKQKPVQTKEVINCISDYINIYQDYNKYIEYAKSEDLKIIITNCNDLDIDVVNIEMDINGVPKSFTGKLLIFLKTRYDSFLCKENAGLNFISCEQVEENSILLRKSLVKLARIKGYNEDFINWLENENRYFNSMVDRIVTGYPRNDEERYQRELGYIDTLMVKGELFHLWIIEDHYNIKEKLLPASHCLNLKFVNDIKFYKDIKLKMMNGTYSCIAPVGYLYGLNTISEAISNSLIKNFARSFIVTEVFSSIDIPKEELAEYCIMVINRFGNPFIYYELKKVLENSSVKYRKRVLPIVNRNLQKGLFPRYALFSLSAQLAYYLGKRDDETIILKDKKNFLSFIKKIKKEFDGTKNSLKDVITKILGNVEIWGDDLSKNDSIFNFVFLTTYLILQNGMRHTLEVFSEK